jgi:hypothetical protein
MIVSYDCQFCPLCFVGYGFFSKVETGIILEQRALGVDWGVDSTWCGAAAEWSNREARQAWQPMCQCSWQPLQAGCLLIPIDMYHGDTKSLQQDSWV